MATGYGTPVRFTKEKNVWDLFLTTNTGSGGALNIAQSVNNQFINKGIANVWQNTPTFTGVTSSGSNTVTSVSNFTGVFTGMAITNSTIPNGATVGTISPSTGSIVFTGTPAGAAFTGSTGATMVVSGGQYIIQFGVLTTAGSASYNSRLDAYNRLLDFNLSFDSSVGSCAASATQQQIAPNVSQYFIVQNNTTVKTIPQSMANSSTDCSLTVQLGTGANGFVPVPPAPGLVMRFDFTFGNTTAV